MDSACFDLTMNEESRMGVVNKNVSRIVEYEVTPLNGERKEFFE